MKKLLLIIVALIVMSDTLVYARGGRGGGGGGHSRGGGGRGGHSRGGGGHSRGGGGRGGSHSSSHSSSRSGSHGGYRGGGYRGGAFGGAFVGGMIGGMMIGGIMASSYRGQPAYTVQPQQGPSVVIVEQGGRPYVVQNDDPTSDPIPWSNAYPNDPAPDMAQLRLAAQNQSKAPVASSQDRLSQLKARTQRDLEELRAEENRIYNQL